MKTEAVESVIIRWTCLTHDAKHMTEEVAAACIARTIFVPKPPKAYPTQTPGIRRAMFVSWLNGGTWKACGGMAGVCAQRARQVVKEEYQRIQKWVEARPGRYMEDNCETKADRRAWYLREFDASQQRRGRA